MSPSEKMSSTKRLTTLAMLTAISVVLVYAIRFPAFLPFLEYDPADIPIFIGTFAFGPMAGLMLTVTVSVIQGLTVSAKGEVIGIIMHIFATGSFVLVAGNVYKKNHSKKGAIISLTLGSITMVLAMIVWNIIITPIYLGAPREEVIKLLVPAIIPFNIMKAGINSVVTLLLYKSVSRFLHK